MTFWDDREPPRFVPGPGHPRYPRPGDADQAGVPGCQIHVRQVGPQIILEGQVPDAKTMSDILQLVTAELRNSGGIRSRQWRRRRHGWRRHGRRRHGRRHGWRRRGRRGGGMGGGGMGGGGMGGGGMGGGHGWRHGRWRHGGGLDRHHQSRPRAGTPSGAAPRQDRRAEPAPRSGPARRELARSPEQCRSSARRSARSATFAATSSVSQCTTGNRRPGLAGCDATFSSTATAAIRRDASSASSTRGSSRSSSNALRSNAWPRSWPSPNLVALDGQPARFLAGGMFPYPVPQSSSIPGGTAVVTVQFANVRCDPELPSPDPGQRRDPPRRRAGLQPA